MKKKLTMKRKIAKNRYMEKMIWMNWKSDKKNFLLNLNVT